MSLIVKFISNLGDGSITDEKLPDGITLANFLRQKNENLNSVRVQVNRAHIPNTEWESYKLHDKDRVSVTPTNIKGAGNDNRSKSNY